MDKTFLQETVSVLSQILGRGTGRLVAGACVSIVFASVSLVPFFSFHGVEYEDFINRIQEKLRARH